MMAEEMEKSPLLENEFSRSKEAYQSIYDRKEVSSENIVKLKRYINLPYAIFIIFGNVVGSGIFVSPKGVTENIGSVGGSLIIWAITGLYNLAQAWCYTELAIVIPKAGGDYAFIYYILGALPAFLCGWVHVAIIASSSCAVIAQTGALYLYQPFDLGDIPSLISLTAVLFIVTLATVNAVSVQWGTRIQAFFSVAKLLALLMIMIIGMVKLAQGNSQAFTNAFDGTTTDPGKIALSIMDGYFAYKGWELVMALPEEMKNPIRDLPRAVIIAMLMVTGVYVFTNMAYFSVLNKSELILSDAVAVEFASRTLGSFSWIIPISVTLSCLGTVNGDFLSNSSCCDADLQVLQEYASLTVQVKVVLALLALFYLRWKRPDIERPVKVNIVLAGVTMIIMLALLALSFYKSPATTGIGVGLFLLGIPLYYLGQLLLKSARVGSVFDKITLVLQKVLLIAPETILPDEDLDPLGLRTDVTKND